MRKGRFVGSFAVALVVLSLLVSACGTASPGAPSRLDPARMAPASTLLYLSLEVRPEGSQAAQTKATLHKLFGASADSSIRQAVDKQLRKLGTSYRSGVKPWLGQRIGVVITQLNVGARGIAARSGVALIAPTSDPQRAQSFIARLIKHNPGTVGRVIHSYAVFGGPAAVRAIAGTRRLTSLAFTPSYETTSAQLGGGDAATIWVNLRQFIGQIAAQLPNAGASASLLKRTEARFENNAAAAAGLKLTPGAITLDTAQTGVRPGPRQAPANVGGLPGGSWLALASSSASGASAKQLQGEFRLGLLGALRHSPTGASVPKAVTVLERDVLPVLGPLSLGIGGTSPLNLMVGLKLTPHSPAAATRLLGMLRARAARSPSLSVTGNATDFSVKTPLGTHAEVRQSHGQVVATYGFPSQSAFLSPAAKLSQSPTYQQALAQLPAGSSVPLYVSFPPIAALVSLLDHKPSAAKTVRALDKLNYLILGGTSGHGRLVLALR